MRIERRAPGRRVDRLEERVIAVRELQDPVPLLLGGHGRRVVGVAARHADIFHLTGLTDGEGGKPEPGGCHPNGLGVPLPGAEQRRP